MKKSRETTAVDTEAVSESTSVAVEETKACPYCAETIKIDAKKCKHCKEVLDEDLRKEQLEQLSLAQSHNWSPGVAAVLSFFVPGLGHMYKGQILEGLFWLLFVVVGYFLLIVPGLVLHLICIFSAASGKPKK
jgi:TM2 domain-containing membrane protein YozV